MKIHVRRYPANSQEPVRLVVTASAGDGKITKTTVPFDYTSDAPFDDAAERVAGGPVRKIGGSGDIYMFTTN